MVLVSFSSIRNSFGYGVDYSSHFRRDFTGIWYVSAEIRSDGF
jgi:hypothetical protein